MFTTNADVKFWETFNKNLTRTSLPGEKEGSGNTENMKEES